MVVVASVTGRTVAASPAGELSGSVDGDSTVQQARAAGCETRCVGGEVQHRPRYLLWVGNPPQRMEAGDEVDRLEGFSTTKQVYQRR